MSALQLKLILLLRSIPNDDIKLRELLNKFGLIERFTPYVAGGRGPLRSDEARKRGDRRTNVSGRDNRHASGCMSSEPFRQVSNKFKRRSGPSELKLWLQVHDAAGVVARRFSA